MEDVKLTEDEAEQYDRQIRLWGLEAQKRLRTSTVLVVGLRGLSAEVCKNVVLAGVRSLTVMDHQPLGAGDIGCRFLCTAQGENRAQQAVPRLQALNPNVDISADTGRVEEKSDEFFTQFTVICATCCSTETLLRLDALCRSNGIKFFCGDVWGFYGYFFTDLSEHDYAMEVPREQEDVVAVEGPRKRRPKRDSEEVETITVKKTCSFCSLKDALSVDWLKKPARYFKRTPPTFFIIQTLQAFRDQHGGEPSNETAASDGGELLRLREKIATKYGISKDLIPEELSKHCFSELSPVCAIVGGVLGQEVIKAISAKDRPYHNCFLYDGVQSTGIIESLCPTL